MVINKHRTSEGCHLPYGMDSFLQFRRMCAFRDEFLHVLKFVFRARFETAGVVKYKNGIALEYHLVSDVMVSSLSICQCIYVPIGQMMHPP
jgi:hypothetical protein